MQHHLRRLCGAQVGDEDEYVEFPLLFNIQNEGLSAMLQTNLDAALAASNRTFDTSDPDFQVPPLSFLPANSPIFRGQSPSQARSPKRL